MGNNAELFNMSMIAWHYEDPKVLDKLLTKIEERLPGLGIDKGEDLKFLGVKIRFYYDSRLWLNIKGYIEECKEQLDQFRVLMK